LDDVHRRDIGRRVLVLVEWNWQLGPIGALAKPYHFFDRTGFDVLEFARRLPEAISKRLDEILRRDAEGARLRATVLHQDVAEPETRFLDDVLEQNRLIALRRQRADIVDANRLGDSRDDVGIGLEISAQRRVESEIR